MTLPLLRRLHQMYDRYVLNESRKKLAAGTRPTVLQQAVRAFLHMLQVCFKEETLLLD